MKNFIKNLMWLLVMCLSALPASAYDFEVDGLYYSVTNQSNNEVAVTYGTTPYNSYSGVINIPPSFVYNGTTYTVTRINSSAFERCTDLISVTIPNSVTSIEYYAFYDCTNIRSLTIGSGVTSIGYNAFTYSIPKVIWLGNTPPSGVDNVSAIVNYVSNSEFSLSNQVVYPFLSSRFEVEGVVYVPISPSDRTCDVIDCNYALANTELKIDSLVVNKNVELKVLDVNEYALYKNSKITKLELSNSGFIGRYAFYDCDALNSVVANNNGYIGESAFYDCKSLTSVILGNNVTTIGHRTFSGNSSLETIIIPNNITSLGAYALSGCTSLKNVSIGEGISSLPKYIFNNCTSLPSIFIPNNIHSINDYAFSGCENLGDVTFEEFIEPQYFPNWTSTNHANNSSSSHEYKINVVAGDVLSFEIWSDSETNDVLTVYLNGTSIATISGKNKTQFITRTFSNAASVTLNVVYSKDYSTSSGNDEAGIRNIALNAIPVTLGTNGSSPLFSSCKLDEVYIGRKLSYNTSSSYGYSPFYRNTSLRKVTITDAETQIYDNEFYGCSNLQEFSCGDGVTSIGKWAFSGCSSLESYVSGTGVESIGQEAFSDCTAMTSFTSNADVPPTCGTQALDDINKWVCTLYVPQESVDNYQAAPQWKEFFFIEESGVEDVFIDNDDTTNCPVEVYNLSGIKVGNSINNLTSGIYIVKQGSKTFKILVK